MKKLLFILILFITFFSCKTTEYGQSPRDNETYRNTPKATEQTKVITAKDAPIESRNTAAILFSWSAARKTETVYYFYAGDGTSIKVDRTTYHQYQVNDSFTGKWK